MICLNVVKLTIASNDLLMKGNPMQGNKMINKLPNFWLKFRYSKIFRLPMWMYNKVIYAELNPKNFYTTKMRLGHKIKLKPTQRYLSNVLVSRQYHDQDIYFVDRIVPDGGVVLDIGANIGLYTCAFAQFFRSKNVKIYAIEAVQSNYNVLNDNVTLNSFSNVKTYRCALGESSGELTFFLPNEGYVGNLAGSNMYTEDDIKNISSDTIKEIVPMITLDDWAKENHIDRCDFMKIDIEGAEMFAFKGGRKFIEKTRPVIQCEYNKGWLDNQNITLNDLKTFFLSMDYIVMVEKGDVFVNLPLNHESYYLVDLLFIPREKESLILSR